MKKLLVSALALTFSLAMYAQDTGAQKAVQVAQIPGSATTANTGESIQNGSSNAVQVRQAGTEQSVLTNQDGVGNMARLMQTGNVNGNQALSGQLNLAEVDQDGYNNQSTTVQEGDFNNAYTKQNNDGGDQSLANRALIVQGTGQQAENNDAAIEQDGADNSAFTQQTYDNSDAWTIQSGIGNASEIKQNAGPENSAGHFAIVDQLGLNNESRINQSGANGDQDRNTAIARQTGMGNDVEQIQVSTGNAGGNTADVLQGFSGDITVYSAGQDDIFDAVNAFDPSLAGDDDGAGFEATNAVAFQTQTGGENDAVIVQFGDGNNAAQSQTGDSNVAQAIQNLTPDAGFGNVSSQTQVGNDNAATIVQNDRIHTSIQSQTGDGNIIVAAQRGTGNVSDIAQEGDASYGRTLQHGDFNVSLLTQRDGQSYSIYQNQNQFGGAGGNQADILQEGPMGTGVQRGLTPYTATGVTAPVQVASFTLAPIN
ncbi:curlin [Dokdonia ponticola]|uniref:Curlin n=1 Tax=Dokdonia ponticola TaxID=2041041 RepID=A0ABV9I020_9FLAO